MPPRVFISSVVVDFEEYREAARRGVEGAECEPVLAERAPSRADTPRNACLDLVESSDAYVGLLGERTGHIADSGKTVVEEEFEEAQRLGKPTLIFVQEGVDLQERQQRFVDRVSEYATGRFRQSFGTPNELEQRVAEALKELNVKANEDADRARDAVTTALDRQLLPQYQQPTLRLAIAPVRIEEVVDLRDLQDPSLTRRLLAIGRDDEVELLDPLAAYQQRLTNEGLTIVHDATINWREPHRVVGLELTESGRLLIEANATSVTRADRTGLTPLLAPEVALQLWRALRFTSAVYDHVDSVERQQRFVYNAGLNDTSFRYLEQELPSQGSAIAMRTNNGHATAHPQPRDISRLQLRQPQDEIDRSMAQFQLKLGREP